jgi:hypothetical protein
MTFPPPEGQAVHAITPNAMYYRRLEARFLNGEPICGKRGHSAKCLLPPGHAGNRHEGNGADEWGPKYQCWESKD